MEWATIFKVSGWLWKVLRWLGRVQPKTKPDCLLVVDDNQDDAFLLSKMISRCGWKCRVTELAETAHALMMEKDYPIVFLDLNLQLSPGWFVLPGLLREFPKTHIVLVTGSHEDLRHVKSGQYVGLLLKPPTLESIQDVLSKTKL